MNWSNYEHSKEWWEGKLTEWLKENPKGYPNATIIEIRESDIVFGLDGVMGRLVVSKETLLKNNSDTNKNNFS